MTEASHTRPEGRFAASDVLERKIVLREGAPCCSVRRRRHWISTHPVYRPGTSSEAPGRIPDVE